MDGLEQYEQLLDKNLRILVHYDYVDSDGRLFSTVQTTLDKCRKERNRWLQENYDEESTY